VRRWEPERPKPPATPLRRLTFLDPVRRLDPARRGRASAERATGGLYRSVPSPAPATGAASGGVRGAEGRELRGLLRCGPHVIRRLAQRHWLSHRWVLRGHRRSPTPTEGGYDPRRWAGPRPATAAGSALRRGSGRRLRRRRRPPLGWVWLGGGWHAGGWRPLGVWDWGPGRWGAITRLRGRPSPCPRPPVRLHRVARALERTRQWPIRPGHRSRRGIVWVLWRAYRPDRLRRVWRRWRRRRTVWTRYRAPPRGRRWREPDPLRRRRRPRRPRRRFPPLRRPRAFPARPLRLRPAPLRRRAWRPSRVTFGPTQDGGLRASLPRTRSGGGRWLPPLGSPTPARNLREGWVRRWARHRRRLAGPGTP
jgi:hypothetical protein